MSQEQSPPKTLSVNETIKAKSTFLRGEIARDMLDASSGTITDESAQLTKFHGLYPQDDRDLRNERR